MRLIRRGAVAVLLAAGLTSSALLGVSLAASQETLPDAEITVVETIDEEMAPAHEAQADQDVEDMATAEEATAEGSAPTTGASDAAELTGVPR